MCLGLKRIVPINFYVLRSRDVGSIIINTIWQLQIAAEFFESTKIKIALF